MSVEQWIRDERGRLVVRTMDTADVRKARIILAVARTDGDVVLGIVEQALGLTPPNYSHDPGKPHNAPLNQDIGHG